MIAIFWKKITRKIRSSWQTLFVVIFFLSPNERMPMISLVRANIGKLLFNFLERIYAMEFFSTRQNNIFRSVSVFWFEFLHENFGHFFILEIVLRLVKVNKLFIEFHSNEKKLWLQWNRFRMVPLLYWSKHGECELIVLFMIITLLDCRLRKLQPQVMWFLHVYSLILTQIFT